MAILIKPAALTESAKINKDMDLLQKSSAVPTTTHRIGTFGIDGVTDVGAGALRGQFYDATHTLQILKKFQIEGVASTVTFGGHFYLVNGEPFNGYGRLEDDNGMEVLQFFVEYGYVEPFEVDVEIFNRVYQIRFWFDTSDDLCPWACYSDYGIGLRELADLIDFNSTATVSNFSGGEEIIANYIIVNPVTKQQFYINVNIQDDNEYPTVGTIEYSQPTPSTTFLDSAWNPQNDSNIVRDYFESQYSRSQATTNELTLEEGLIPMLYITTNRERLTMYLPCEGDGHHIEVRMDETGYIFEWICY